MGETITVTRNTYRVEAKYNGNNILSMGVGYLPGNCGGHVLIAPFIAPNIDEKILNKGMYEIEKRYNYDSLLLLTITSSNKKVISLLRKRGFSEVFKSRGTHGGNYNMIVFTKDPRKSKLNEDTEPGDGPAKALVREPKTGRAANKNNVKIKAPPKPAKKIKKKKN